MEWVKLAANYYLDPAICGLDGDAELLFVRSLAYSGSAETSGFIPTPILPQLGRRNITRSAEKLIRAGLWEAMPGGYRVKSWDKWQVNISEVREQWRERQKKARKKRRAEGSVTWLNT